MPVSTFSWASKMIAFTKDLIPHPRLIEGQKPRVGKMDQIPPNLLVFNHYNTNEMIIREAQAKFNSKATNLVINNGMKRYFPLMKEVCNGGCS